MADALGETLLTLTVDIVAAHVASNSVAVGDLPALIGKVHEALAGLGEPSEAAKPVLSPAVSIRASIRPDHLVCLEDGKKMKLLKRHLRTDHQLSPAEYRSKWSLPKDYPMVARAYAEARRGLALSFGLGRKKEAVTAPAVSAKPARKARTTKPKTVTTVPAKPGKARVAKPKTAPAR